VELSDVPDFLAASRERSLSGAARRLGVNQATMSRRMAEAVATRFEVS
jgi:DNA-binding transcriptional LysR family regulator